MEPQALPGRVACQNQPAHTFGRPVARSLRLWPKLSAETQVQITQLIAVLMRRMQPTSRAPTREKGRADRRESG
jgi:hypothetical protein